jgi:inner membrane protein
VIPGVPFWYWWIAAVMLSIAEILLPSTLGSWVFGRRVVRQHLAASDEPNLNRRGEQYIGQRFALTESILGGHGRTKIGDSVWMVEGEEDLDTGTLVTVVGVRGIRLKVEKAP